MEKSQKTPTITKCGAGLLIFLCWLLYSTSYLGKVNYSANIVQIQEFYGVTKDMAGLAPTFLFFAYGVGQIVNGLLCRNYNIKWMIFGSMMISGIINLIIGFTSNFAIVKWLWLINGIALSVLWPTLIRLIAESLPKKDLAKSSAVIGTTVATGTLVIYGLSALYAAFDAFKLAFYTAGIVMPIVAFIWLVLFKEARRRAVAAKELEEGNEQAVKEEKKTLAPVAQKSHEKKLLYITIFVLCFFAIGVNLIKDGLTTWTPSILKESFGVNDSISILLTLLLPIVAVFGNFFALMLHKKIPDYVSHSALMFFVSSGLICLIVGCFSWNQVVVVLICLAVVNLLISSVNSLVTNIFPTFMRGKVNSGLFAGIINGFCYLGSTISSYGLGLIAEYFGNWSSVFWTLFGFAVVVCFIWLIYFIVKSIMKRAD